MHTFFTADTHFGHGGALGLHRRPFPSVAAMDAAMLERWQATVTDADTVWHLGDFAVNHKQPAALLAALPGRKHLLSGNNDPPEIAALPGWASVQPYAEVTVDGAALILCHYAFRTWRDMHRGTWNLHGHSHGVLPRQRHQADVGVDVWDFRPVTLAEILAQPTRRRTIAPNAS